MIPRTALALLVLCAASNGFAQSFSSPGEAYATPQQVRDVVSAVQPQASSAIPPAAALDSKVGVSTSYARADHTHAARVQLTVMTTAADGTVIWTFARPIVCPAGKLPPISNMVEDTGSPVVVQITGRAFTSDATAGTDTHTAVTIKAQRSQFLPATLVSVAALVSFNVFGASASGVKVNLWAADPTQ